MTKQQLAQKRNYFKMVLTGLIKPIDLEVLTEEERFFWHTIESHKNKLLSVFNSNSIDLGLKVIEPCWCGSRRKTKCLSKECQINKNDNK